MTERAYRYPEHPARTVAAARALWHGTGAPNDVIRAAEFVIKTVQPPAELVHVREAAALLSDYLPYRKAALDRLTAYMDAHYSFDAPAPSFSGKTFPLYAALKKLHALSAKGGVWALVTHFANRYTRAPTFSGPAYYRDVIAIRDALEVAYARSSLDAAPQPNRDELVQTLERLHSNIGTRIPKPNIELKIEVALRVVTGGPLLGLVRYPRTSTTRRRSRIGKPLNAPRATATLEADPVESEVVIDDGGGILLREDDDARRSHTDRTYRRQDLLRGFARTNVKTVADMAACSVATYVDFLATAFQSDVPAVRALAWLAGVPGIDISRPFKKAADVKSKPEGEEIVVAASSVRYHIMRRRFGPQHGEFETAGTMDLPIPGQVSDGLQEILARSPHKPIPMVLAHAVRTFAAFHSGLPPTANRLRSSSRVHFAPFGLSELFYAAVSGTVPAGLKARSHYYPLALRDVVARFSQAYQMSDEEWQLFEAMPLPEERPDGDHWLLATPSSTQERVHQLLHLLAAQYASEVNALDRRRPVHVEQLLKIVNTHQLAVYALQEYGAGLRPTGEVARLSIQSNLRGMSCDKGSRLFSERSYSPLSDRHVAVAEVARANRQTLSTSLHRSGIAEQVILPTADLACHYHTRKGIVVRQQMTGTRMRKLLDSLGALGVLPHARNWLRRMFAESIHERIPVWQADELLSHKAVGQEPFGIYSTAGLRHFRETQRFLETLHQSAIPDALLRPLRFTGRVRLKP